MTKPKLEQGVDYERGFIDGMQKQMQSSVDKAVNRLAQPKREPVAWADHGVVNWIADKQFKHSALLYEAPQRTWVGLSWEEIYECFKITPDQYLPAQIYRRIEAKLKQKNGYAEDKNT